MNYIISLSLVVLIAISCASAGQPCSQLSCSYCCDQPSGGACYDSKSYVCASGVQLCPTTAPALCGNGCYDPAKYNCRTGSLQEGPEVTAAPTQQPSTQAPTQPSTSTHAPVTQAPTTPAPTTQAPVTTQAPTQPSTSTHAPITQAQTTPAPTTQAPTTTTTQAPTTTTTQAPTTPSASTQAPSTPAPTSQPVQTYPGVPYSCDMVNCPSGYSCCLITKPQGWVEAECYDPSKWNCVQGKTMCPVPMQGCGLSCYNTAYYSCENAQLQPVSR